MPNKAPILDWLPGKNIQDAFICGTVSGVIRSISRPLKVIFQIPIRPSFNCFLQCCRPTSEGSLLLFKLLLDVDTADDIVLLLTGFLSPFRRYNIREVRLKFELLYVALKLL